MPKIFVAHSGPSSFGRSCLPLGNQLSKGRGTSQIYGLHPDFHPKYGNSYKNYGEIMGMTEVTDMKESYDHNLYLSLVTAVGRQLRRSLPAETLGWGGWV